MIAFVTTGADFSFCIGRFFSGASIDEEVWGGAPVARDFATSCCYLYALHVNDTKLKSLQNIPTCMIF